MIVNNTKVEFFLEEIKRKQSFSKISESEPQKLFVVSANGLHPFVHKYSYTLFRQRNTRVSRETHVHAASTNHMGIVNGASVPVVIYFLIRNHVIVNETDLTDLV